MERSGIFALFFDLGRRSAKISFLHFSRLSIGKRGDLRYKLTDLIPDQLIFEGIVNLQKVFERYPLKRRKSEL